MTINKTKEIHDFVLNNFIFNNNKCLEKLQDLSNLLSNLT
jgi:hypothetical protein